jgi:NAD(P)H dehydrogenase (quinone)
MHHGMLVLGLPYTEPALTNTVTGGTPYGVTHVSGGANEHPISQDEIILAKHLGERLGRTAMSLAK